MIRNRVAAAALLCRQVSDRRLVLRKLTIAALVAASAVPAAAQPVAPRSAPSDEEFRQAVPDQREMEKMGDVAANAIDALMDVPVGPLREAIEGRKLSPRERQETLGDHAGRDDPQFRERMRDQIGVVTIALGALTQHMAEIAPVLRRTLEDVEQRMDNAVRGLPPRDNRRP